VGAVLGLWALIAALGIVPELFVPSPASVWRAFLATLITGYRGSTLLGHLGMSLARVLGGFVLAVVTAVPLGLLMGRKPAVQAALDPLVEFYRPLPPLAYYTLLIVWLGIGDASKIALLYLAAFPPLSISAMSAVRGINPRRIESAQCLGADGFSLFSRIIVPSCLPEIFTGLRVSIGFTYTTLVSSEIVAAANGIGWMVLDASRFLRTDVIFVSIIVMGLTGLLLDRAIRFIERRLIPWKGR